MSENNEPLAGEVVPYATVHAIEEYRARIMMEPAEAKALSDQLRECMLAVLREGIDYGTIPGAGDKKNLLKPGAEKLLQWFGFGSRSAEVKTERDEPDRSSGIADKASRIGVTYRTEVTKAVPGGGEVVVATCEGYAGYDEDRYYTNADDARSKAEAKERFWASKDGRKPNPAKWENVAAEYRAPWNTLIKMSQKRSYVGAAIDATGAAGLFTQDMEDMAGDTTAPAAMSAAGRAAIAALPEGVRTELDAWYSALNWPDPNAWDADQWCTALIKAGKLSATPAQAYDQQQHATAKSETRREGDLDQRQAQAAPKGDLFFTKTPQGEQEALAWVEEFTRRLSNCTTKDEGTRLYKVAAEMGRQRVISRAEAQRLQAMVVAQMADLQTKAGTVIPPGLDPEDAWVASIQATSDEGDCDAAEADARKQMESGTLSQAKGNAVLNAIASRRSGFLGRAA